MFTIYRRLASFIREAIRWQTERYIEIRIRSSYFRGRFFERKRHVSTRRRCGKPISPCLQDIAGLLSSPSDIGKLMPGHDRSLNRTQERRGRRNPTETLSHVFLARGHARLFLILSICQKYLSRSLSIYRSLLLFHTICDRYFRYFARRIHNRDIRSAFPGLEET